MMINKRTKRFIFGKSNYMSDLFQSASNHSSTYSTRDNTLVFQISPEKVF